MYAVKYQKYNKLKKFILQKGGNNINENKLNDIKKICKEIMKNNLIANKYELKDIYMLLNEK